ncbi:MAG: PHP domain-containing protein, partial [Candidatus Izemoplasmatales bacterium]
MFVHLHGHSTYSVLDGLCKIDDLIDKAVDNGMEALAITDHASISCLDEFYYKAKDKNIKPIIGAEFYVVNDKFTQEKKKKRYHLLVLAKNWDGILSINKMLTKANMYFNKRPLIDWDDALCFNNCVISTACSSGVLSHPDYNVLVESFYQTYKDDFYLEIMPFQVFYSEENDDKDVKDMQKIINEKAVDLHKKYGIKCICTNDYHFINREDYKSHEVLLAIQRKTTMNNPKRWKFDTDDVYFKTESEMLRACQEMGFNDDFIIEMFLNIQEIVNKCNVEIPKFEFDLPSPYEGDDEEILMDKVAQGWQEKIVSYIDDNKINLYLERLRYELDVIKKLGLGCVRYFLIVEDIVRFAKENNILVGYGRGSV